MSETRYEHIQTKTTLNRVKEEAMPFEWSINPYRGCGHGCSFCYARAFQTFLGRSAEDEFQFHISVKENAAEALERQLTALTRKFAYDIEAVSRHVGQVAIGTATDPYQPVEAKEQITRECLKVLAKYRIHTSVTTRSPLVMRDIDILRKMRGVSVNISVNTLDAELIRKLEPASPHPGKRLATVKYLAEHGIPVGIFAAPVLPFLTDSEEGLDNLLRSAKEHGAGFAMISLLRLSPDVKAWYFRTLQQHDPKLVSRYRALYAGAYAEPWYTDRFKRMARALLAKHGLDGSETRGAQASSGIGTEVPALRPGAVPQPACTVSEREITPEVEQLSFPF
ncbi:radical SAM protein [Paenibacillus macerans]|uniref:Radical SAM protein n=1 Tax=Paenibacillus macerans TaxID=44252 RepID=A0A6N8EXF3_PAEMA|nr:radical SAM protein [Paenibacillus macerans]MBS5911902.1 radical SAM protein [Paenibacillus macerans]MUG24509.1 radical SAM protein [Paenibacillus macerans]GBK60925.1 radical SAM protein [Paenibacillus macerans]GBK67226.1 radical SAM protein [Paenibacillus macerans]